MFKNKELQERIKSLEDYLGIVWIREEGWNRHKVLKDIYGLLNRINTIHKDVEELKPKSKKKKVTECTPDFY